MQAVCVAHGSRHSVVVTALGSVYSWGSGAQGQLGVASAMAAKGQPRTAAPALVAALDSVRVVAVAAGDMHSVALTDDGGVYAWGWNGEGQCGVRVKQPGWGEGGAASILPIPRFVGRLGGARIVQVACGARFTLAVGAEGGLWAWGEGRCGQLGRGPNEALASSDEPRPVTLDVDAQAGDASHGGAGGPGGGGEAKEADAEDAREALRSVSSHVVRAAAGAGHCVALTASGHVWAWGLNAKGQLGLGDMAVRRAPVLVRYRLPETRPLRDPRDAPPRAFLSSAPLGLLVAADVAAGAHHSAAVTQSGRLYLWGSAEGGRLGVAAAAAAAGAGGEGGAAEAAAAPLPWPLRSGVGPLRSAAPFAARARAARGGPFDARRSEGGSPVAGSPTSGIRSVRSGSPISLRPPPIDTESHGEVALHARSLDSLASSSAGGGSPGLLHSAPITAAAARAPLPLSAVVDAYEATRVRLHEVEAGTWPLRLERTAAHEALFAAERTFIVGQAVHAAAAAATRETRPVADAAARGDDVTASLKSAVAGAFAKHGVVPAVLASALAARTSAASSAPAGAASATVPALRAEASGGGGGRPLLAATGTATPAAAAAPSPLAALTAVPCGHGALPRVKGAPWLRGPLPRAAAPCVPYPCLVTHPSIAGRRVVSVACGAAVTVVHALAHLAAATPPAGLDTGGAVLRLCGPGLSCLQRLVAAYVDAGRFAAFGAPLASRADVEAALAEQAPWLLAPDATGRVPIPGVMARFTRLKDAVGGGGDGDEGESKEDSTSGSGGSEIASEDDGGGPVTLLTKVYFPPGYSPLEGRIRTRSGAATAAGGRKSGVDSSASHGGLGAPPAEEEDDDESDDDDGGDAAGAADASNSEAFAAFGLEHVVTIAPAVQRPCAMSLELVVRPPAPPLERLLPAQQEQQGQAGLPPAPMQVWPALMSSRSLQLPPYGGVGGEDEGAAVSGPVRVRYEYYALPVVSAAHPSMVNLSARSKMGGGGPSAAAPGFGAVAATAFATPAAVLAASPLLWASAFDLLSRAEARVASARRTSVNALEDWGTDAKIVASARRNSVESVNGGAAAAAAARAATATEGEIVVLSGERLFGCALVDADARAEATSLVRAVRRALSAREVLELRAATLSLTGGSGDGGDEGGADGITRLPLLHLTTATPEDTGHGGHPRHGVLVRFRVFLDGIQVSERCICAGPSDRVAYESRTNLTPAHRRLR